MHVYTVQVAWSPSYRVPLLLLDARSIDGRPLKREEILADLHAHGRPPRMVAEAQPHDASDEQAQLASDGPDLSEEANWTFLTQTEHPLLGRPCFGLHPCRTAEWVGVLLHAATATSLAPAGGAQAEARDEEIGDLDDELRLMAANSSTRGSQASSSASEQTHTAVVPASSQDATALPSSPTTTSTASASLPLLVWLSAVAPVVAFPLRFTAAMRQMLQASGNGEAPPTTAQPNE